MERWQVMGLAAMSLFVTAAAGMALRRPEPVEVARPSEPVAVVAPTMAPQESPEVSPTPQAEPAKVAKKPDAVGRTPMKSFTPAVKRGRLPSDLAKRLKLDEAQSARVGEALSGWDAGLKKLDQAKKEAFEQAKQSADAAVRSQLEAAALDRWRMDYTALKNERAANLAQSMTPVQAAEYQKFRDEQYDKWLTQKTTMLTQMGRALLDLSPEQQDRVSSAVRGSYDRVTFGGGSVPTQAARESEEESLRAQLRGILTPEQLTRFESGKFGLLR